MNITKPIIRKIKDNETALAEFEKEIKTNEAEDTKDIIMNFPTVYIHNWPETNKPWNYELEQNLNKDEKKKIKEQAWAEQAHTIAEVGSTYTIQGFDLNYAGVILGKSVKYRNGKIVYDPSETSNGKVTKNRTMEDGTKQNFAKELLKHEIRVLMTRGVNGLYIYACDDQLREALKKAAEQE